MKHSFLNNLQKCRYKEYNGNIVEGYVLAKRDSKNHYLVYTINGDMGHDCGVNDCEGIQQDGYIFYITEKEFQLLRNDHKMWYVSEHSFINIIEVENNNKHSINVTVDENGKILITKD